MRARTRRPDSLKDRCWGLDLRTRSPTVVVIYRPAGIFDRPAGLLQEYQIREKIVLDRRALPDDLNNRFKSCK